MAWLDELGWLRRYLRDPSGAVWSEALLRGLYNEVASDLQTRTGALEELRAMAVPPRFNCSHVHAWEWSYAGARYGDTVLHVLRQQGGHYAYTANFEAQAFLGVTADAVGEGSAVTHPWEAWLESPGAPVPMPLPHNLHALQAVYYDLEPLQFDDRAKVLGGDPSHQTRAGEPECVYATDSVSHLYTLYPRASTASWDDGSGEGSGQYVDGDTSVSEYGVAIRRDGDWVSTGLGITADVVDADGALLLVYKVRPAEVEGMDDELDWPAYLGRYVRYGVLARAYLQQGDGRIESLAAWWQRRYEQGAQLVKRFLRLRQEDRTYRLAGGGRRSEAPRWPRLPSTYPDIGRPA